jgi:hypothetical protein
MPRAAGAGHCLRPHYAGRGGPGRGRGVWGGRRLPDLARPVLLDRGLGQGTGRYGYRKPCIRMQIFWK